MFFDRSIQSGTPVCERFLGVGKTNFGDAVSYVRRLPYGRTAHQPDCMEVLTEQKGTCSTKHALLAKLAAELQIPFSLMIGIYTMDEQNTPGVGAVLKKYGLTTIPEAHCYLRIGDQRYDFTRNADSPQSPFSALLYEEEIEPEQIGDYKGGSTAGFSVVGPGLKETGMIWTGCGRFGKPASPLYPSKAKTRVDGTSA